MKGSEYIKALSANGDKWATRAIAKACENALVTETLRYMVDYYELRKMVEKKHGKKPKIGAKWDSEVVAMMNKLKENYIFSKKKGGAST